MENTATKIIVEQLAANVLNTRFEDIDQATVDNTKKRIFDMIGCAVGGARGPGNAELVAVIKGWVGNNEATILGYGVKGPAHEVAPANCIFGRTFDWGPLTLIIDGKRFPNHSDSDRHLTDN